MITMGARDGATAHEVRTERRSRARLRALVAVFAVAGLVAATLTIIATEQAERASNAARIARARELAAAALSNLEEDPEGSVLLAVAAIDETRAVDGSVLPEAEEALHRAIETSRVAMTVPNAGGAVAWGSAGTFAAVAADPPGAFAIGDDHTGEVVRRSTRMTASSPMSRSAPTAPSSPRPEKTVPCTCGICGRARPSRPSITMGSRRTRPSVQMARSSPPCGPTAA